MHDLVVPIRKTMQAIVRAFVTAVMAVTIGCLIGGVTRAEDKAPNQDVRFETHVAPILLEHCMPCHGPKKAEGGYRVDTGVQLKKAGDSGLSPLSMEPNSANELLRRIETQDASERMPAESEPLSPEQIQTIRAWVSAGGKIDSASEKLPLHLASPPSTYVAPPAYPRSIPLLSMTFTPDGSRLITAGLHEVLVWKVNADATCTLERRIANMPERIYAMVMTADGKELIVGGGTPGRLGEVRSYDWETGTLKRVVARTHEVVLDIALSPDRKKLAVASGDTLIRIVPWEGDLNQETKTIASHADWVLSVAWSPDGSKLVSGSRDKSAKVFDMQSYELIANYQGHGAPVRSVLFSEDGKQIYSTGLDQKWHRWDVEGTKKIAEAAITGESLKTLLHQQKIWIATSERLVSSIDLKTNKADKAVRDLTDWATSIAIHPTQGWLAIGTFDGQASLWTVEAQRRSQWRAFP
ncbi:MAG: c-type cytochrome domain-containing protein [Pirellulales bacterium]